MSAPRHAVPPPNRVMESICVVDICQRNGRKNSSCSRPLARVFQYVGHRFSGAEFRDVKSARLKACPTPVLFELIARVEVLAR